MQHNDYADMAETLDAREQASATHAEHSEPTEETAQAETTPLAASGRATDASEITETTETTETSPAEPAEQPASIESTESTEAAKAGSSAKITEATAHGDAAHGDTAPGEQPHEAAEAAHVTGEAVPTGAGVTSPGGGQHEPNEAKAPTQQRFEPPQQPTAPLGAGAVLGEYRIVQTLSATPGSARYLATLASQPEVAPTPDTNGANDTEATEATDAAEPQPAWFTIIEQPETPSARLFDLVTLGLRHPRLMAPEAIVTEGGRFYLVMQSLHDTPDAPVLSVGQGARLGAVETLRAGVGLADALSYLHRNGVAHLHVSPETLLTQQGRAYLTGLEEATLLDWDTAESQQLFARDANFLARTLGALRGFTTSLNSEEAPTGEATSEAANDTSDTSDATAERQVRAIAIKGETEGFETPDEVRLACANALRALGVAVDALDSLGTAAPPTRLVFMTGSATTVGRVRSENQDALATTLFDLQDDVTKGGLDAPMGVFLVSDGMGGEAHGEIASRITARAVTVEMARHFTLPRMLWPILTISPDSPGESATPPREEKSPERPTDDEAPTGEKAEQEQKEENKTAGEEKIGDLAQALALAVAEANRQTRIFARQLGAATGATLTAIATSGARAALAHLGDSRAYLLREMQFIRLTEDHSLLARMEAMDHPLLSDPNFLMPRSVLYRSIGQDDEAPPDMLEFTLNPGDRLLLCSDGLWDELSDQTLGQEVAAATDPQVCAERLVALANAAGGHDNSTAVVVFVSAAVPVELADENAATEAAPDLAEVAGAEPAQGESLAQGGQDQETAGANGSHEADDLANVYASASDE